MNIAVEARYLLTREKTGVENYTYGLLAALSRLESDQQLHLYLHRRPRSQEFDLLQPFLASPRSFFHVVPPLKLWLKLWLPLAARWQGMDIGIFPGSILPWWLPFPGVMVVYDLCWASYPECYPAREIRIFRDLYPRDLKRAKLVFAISEWTKGEITRVYGTAPEKIRVVPCGVDEGFVPDSEEEARSPAPLGLDPGYILAVGTSHPRKNIGVLLKAYALLPAAGRPPLVLIGPEGDTASPLRQLAEALGIGPQLRWLGYVGRESLPALYRRAGVFVMPSLQEGFGMPVLEAMACGTPVICSNTTALPEVAGEAGLLIDPTRPEELAEAMAKVLSDKSLAGLMRDKGLIQAGGFSWEKSGRLALSYLREAWGS